MNINSNIKNISQILGDNAIYEVTRFQREYAWGKDELEELWTDIRDSIKISGEQYSSSDYFIGSSVMIQKNENEYQIIDGQQRLTTISILISAIIEKLKESDASLAKDIYYKYIEGKKSSGEKTFKIINENTEKFLNTRILYFDKKDIDPKTSEEDKLLFSFKFFQKKIDREMNNKRIKNLIFLKALIDQIKKLKLIFTTVDDESEAYTIFETLNSKGQDLENIDLVKNLIFKLYSEKFPLDQAKHDWKEIKSSLLVRKRNLNIDDYFRTYWLSQFGYVSKVKLYKSVKGQITKQDQAEKLLRDLKVNVTLYQKISNPQEGDWTENEKKIIYNFAKSMQLFNVTSVKPFILALLLKLEMKLEGNVKLIKIKDVRKILTTIENFHFKFTAISSQKASGLDRLYAKYAKQITNSATIKDTRIILNEMSEQLKKKSPTKEIFIEEFKKLYFTNEVTKDKKLIQYIFIKWEYHLRGTKELTVNPNTLEHIFSQNSKEKFVGYIGNLVAIDGGLNERLKTKPLVEKMVIMAESDLEVVKLFVKEYSEVSDWNEEAINERTIKIAEQAYNEIWK